MMAAIDFMEQVYQAAAHAGLLKACVWQPAAGGSAQTCPVGLRAPDENVLDNLALSRETVMTYPASCFTGLAPREGVTVDGVAYQVRIVTAVGDGSEMRASLMRV